MLSFVTAWKRAGNDGRATARRVLDFGASVIGIGCLIASLAPHVKVVAYPGPQELNEPAAWYATHLLANGRNPFLPEELPGGAQFFGPLYNYLVIALQPVLGSGYQAHRLLNLLCIGAALWLLGAFMRRLGAAWGVILPALSVLYWIILDNIMITARPDAPGWLLFLGGLFWPAARGYSIGASAVGLLLALLAFQFKAYFALAGCATLLGLASLRSMRAAIWSGVVFFSALILSVAATTWFFPLYFLESFVMQRSMVAGNSSDEMSRVHTLLFLERAWPFLIFSVAGLGLWWRNRGRARWEAWRGGRTGWGGFLCPRTPNEVLGVVLLLHLALVYFYMGRNGGAWFTYHIHLLFPLLFVVTAWVASDRRFGGWVTLIVAVFAIGSLQVRWAPTDSSSYERLRTLIAEEPGEVFALPAAVEPLAQNGKTVYDDGFTVFLGFALGQGRPDRMLAAKMVEERCKDAEEEIARKVGERAFGLIITEENVSLMCDMELIKANYRVVEAFQMPTYFGHGPVWVWRPRPAGETGDAESIPGEEETSEPERIDDRTTLVAPDQPRIDQG